MSNTTRRRRAVFAGALSGVVIVAGYAQAETFQITENFDFPPAWIGSNNTSNGTNNYGWRPTSQAGGSAGELGGQIKRRAQPNAPDLLPNYFGADVGSLTVNDSLTMSGQLNNVQRINDGQGGSGYYFGWFNSENSGYRLINFIGLRFDDNDIYINFGGAGDAHAESIRVTRLTTNTVNTFNFGFTPEGGAFGRGVATISVNSGTIVSLDMTQSVFEQGIDLNRFGVRSVDLDDGDTQLIAYDNLSYTSGLAPGTNPAPGWAVDAPGDWTDSPNWVGGVPNAIDAFANLGNIISQNRTVTVGSGITVGTLRFGDDNSYSLAGSGSILFDTSGAPSYVLGASGSHAIGVPIHAADPLQFSIETGATVAVSSPINLQETALTLTKTGSGVLNLGSTINSGTNSTMNVVGGLVTLNADLGVAATAGTPANAKLQLNAITDGDLEINTDQNLRGLNAGADPTDQEIDVKTATVRLYGADLVATEQSVYLDIQNAVLSASGRDGIFSSADPGPNFAVGVTDQAVDANGAAHVLLRLTRQGDANVDGVVSLDDFTALAAGFGVGGRWDNGDFNFDGLINLDDFTALAANFGLAAADAPRSSVPEPGALGAIGVLAAGLLRRRR